MKPVWVQRHVVLVLLGLALFLPRLSAGWSEAMQRDLPDERSQAAVGYARQRLWSDFLRARQLATYSSQLPDPTLAEYREFLSGLGLKRRGDAAALVVLPVLSEAQLSRQIEVRLDQAHPPIRLKLYERDESSSLSPVGCLEIRVDAGNIVSCLPLPESESKFFSYWPLRPSPLLP